MQRPPTIHKSKNGIRCSHEPFFPVLQHRARFEACRSNGNSPMTTNYIGLPISRVDGPAKVTGRAKYAGEYKLPNLAHGVVVSSAIAKGRITKIITNEALRLDGVIQIFTHENAPPTSPLDESYHDESAPLGSSFRPLYDDRIMFSGQPVALVVAETFE